MARFDVYPGARGRGYLLDCQADVLSHLESRVVVPLLPTGGLPEAGRLNPLLTIDGIAHVMATQLIFAIPAHRLGRPVANQAVDHDHIMNALDLLLTGI